MCAITEAEECDTIDKRLAVVGFQRSASSLDGNCFFSSVVRLLASAGYVSPVPTPAALRRLAADMLSSDMFGVDYGHLLELATSPTAIRPASIYNWYVTACVKVSAGTTGIEPVVQYVKDFGANGVAVDQSVACPLIADIYRTAVRNYYVRGDRPKFLLDAVEYPPVEHVGHSDMPPFNIIFLASYNHFQPSIPIGRRFYVYRPEQVASDSGAGVSHKRPRRPVMCIFVPTAPGVHEEYETYNAACKTTDAIPKCRLRMPITQSDEIWRLYAYLGSAATIEDDSIVQLDVAFPGHTTCIFDVPAGTQQLHLVRCGLNFKAIEYLLAMHADGK
jgi:hypothetical protein